MRLVFSSSVLVGARIGVLPRHACRFHSTESRAEGTVQYPSVLAACTKPAVAFHTRSAVGTQRRALLARLVAARAETSRLLRLRVHQLGRRGAAAHGGAHLRCHGFGLQPRACAGGAQGLRRARGQGADRHRQGVRHRGRALRAAGRRLQHVTASASPLCAPARRTCASRPDRHAPAADEFAFLPAIAQVGAKDEIGKVRPRLSTTCPIYHARRAGREVPRPSRAKAPSTVPLP